MCHLRCPVSGVARGRHMQLSPLLRPLRGSRAAACSNGSFGLRRIALLWNARLLAGPARSSLAWPTCMTTRPSGQRRPLQAPIRKNLSSSPTPVTSGNPLLESALLEQGLGREWQGWGASHFELGQATWDHSTLDHTTAMLAWSRCVAPMTWTHAHARMNAHEMA